jgi:ribosomal protein L2
MKRVLKHLRETRIGDSTSMRIGLTVVFGKNEESWTGRILDMGTLPNGKIFCYIKDAVSDSGKVQSFDIESKEIIKTITDLELEHGFCG